nr:MAG TPA: Transcription initiation factor IIE, alpha FINGER, Transcription [Caudoviricetes sp.]
MKKYRYRIRVFVCPECGNTSYASKKAGRMTTPGHIKDLWCPYCKKFQKMTQIE